MQQRIRRRLAKVDEEIQPRRRFLRWLRWFEDKKNEKNGGRPEREQEDKEVKDAENAEMSYEDSLRSAIQHNQSQSYRQEVTSLLYFYRNTMLTALCFAA